MTFCIITHVHHSQSNGRYFGYAPYVNEMNTWLKHVDKVILVAPLKTFEKTAIHQNYDHSDIVFIAVPDFSLTSFSAILKTIFNLPMLLFSIFKAMKSSSHIHLRCPGNMGLLGCFVQVFFPNKKKTAKYAGNWDPASKQPYSYRLQKKILSNTFLTRNMRILVYGNWEHQSKNIHSFFTATYAESEKNTILPKSLNGKLKFLFVGTLSKGKQPLLAIELVRMLKEKGHEVQLQLFGDGSEKQNLAHFIQKQSLTETVFLKGTVGREALKNLYTESHFLILPSKSEGWPKVVAEAMFWGCLPIVTPVSCVPSMLENENRGILIEATMLETLPKIEAIIGNQEVYDTKIKNAIWWSRKYTIDTFEKEIMQLLHS